MIETLERLAYAAGPEPAKVSKRMVLCPKCGRYGTVHVNSVEGRRYLRVRHAGRNSCYIGPADKPESWAKIGLTFMESWANSGLTKAPTEKALIQAPFQEMVGGRGLVWSRTQASRACNPGSNPGGRTTLSAKEA